MYTFYLKFLQKIIQNNAIKCPVEHLKNTGACVKKV